MQRMNHLEIYRLLEKSNCKRCGLPTCLAFAAAVMRGEMPIDRCPHVEGTVAEQVKGRLAPLSTYQDEQEKTIRRLRALVRDADLTGAAGRLGASRSTDGALTVQCLSKCFHVQPDGNVRSDCHATPWLIVPLLNYVLHCSGKKPEGRWVFMKELKGGLDWTRLFAQRCEKPLKRLIDNHTGLFEDLITIFDGQPLRDPSSCDFSVVLRPLPKVPVLIRYWREEGEYESTLSVMFDPTAEDNLGAESLFTICVGLVTMFERIALTHGDAS